MGDFVTVVSVLSNLAVIILCAFLVAFLVRLKAILQVMEKDVRELSTRTVPILDNIEVITDKIRNVAENVDDQVALVRDSINSVREIANNVVDFERRIQARIEEPVLETIGTVAAVLKGVRAFFVRLKA
jgi:uncharacterized protein YoxC